MAERVGFEPTNTVRCYTLSRRAPSTARPPLHKTSNLLKPPGGIARGRKGTRGDPSDQIYGGAELEGSGTEGTAAGGGGTVCISLAALLGGAGW